MKRIIILTLLILSGSARPAVAQVSFGVPRLINDNWLFHEGDREQMAAPDGKLWQVVNLPHDWSVRGQLSPTLASCTGYLPGGIAWYKKQLDVPETEKGRKQFLYFEGVYNYSDVYINGHHLGHRPNGYISFMYDATPYINYGGDNTIEVRVDHSRSADSRWYTGSGIYRNVWLVSASPVHKDQWGVFVYPESADTRQAVMKVSVEVVNESEAPARLTVLNELLSPEGVVVAKMTDKVVLAAGGKAEVGGKLKVRSPRLWNIDNPVLYTLKTTVMDGELVVDETYTQTGIRTFTFDPDRGFALNGEWMKLKGVCLHHDAGVLGSAVPREVWKRRLLTLKSIGCNAIRTSHNPQSPDLYDLCDKLGLLVIDEAYDEWEFPKRKWLAGWNKGTPGYEGPYEFFEEWGEKDLADLVKRDRNHVSIFAWSIGNEVDYPNDPYSHPSLDGTREGGFTQKSFGGYRPDAPDAMRLGGIAKRLAATVRANDPSRPVTAGLAGVVMSNETDYPGALDIAGYNYTESRYIEDHIKYPRRVIYGSENRHDLEAWKAVEDNDHIFGQFLWTGIDYLGESGAWPSRGFYSGLLDFGGEVKPRGWYRKSLWTTEPMAYLGTYPLGGGANADLWSQSEEAAAAKAPSIDAWPVWNYRQGEIVRVVCYTNTAQTALILNGRQVGETKPYDTSTGVTYWDIPYEDGVLEVHGMDEKGARVASYNITSSGRPAAVVAVADKPQVSKERELIQVTVEVVDADGVRVMLSDDEVTCHISGPARLLGMEASNNTDMGDYTDNVQRVFNGRMIVYLETTGEPGQVEVTFTAPWLMAGRVEVSSF